MIKILETIKEYLPSDSKISTFAFEGANIILYSKSVEFFLDHNSIIRDIVNQIKKRVELRPDPSLTMDRETAEAKIREIVPTESGLSQVLFDPQRSQVILEAEKPGIAIGKSGEVLKEIKKQTLWIPLVKRTPAIRSKLIENIRTVLYENNDYRKKFLNKIGERIYGDTLREKKAEWIRITILGGGRQVGRSCLLLQTPESNVLLDCGINVAASGQDQYPFLDAPEFDISKLDAIIISHSHIDHCGLVPLLFKYGYRGPVYCTEPTRDVVSLLCLDMISISQKEATNPLYSSNEVKEMVKHTVTLDFDEVTDITPDVRLTLHNAGHVLGSSICHLHIGNGAHNLAYTGDMNYEMSPLLSPATTKFPRLETVIMESTYGSKDDEVESREDAEAHVIEIINKTIENGGKVLFPVLGVGRSQDIMIMVEKAIRLGKLPEIPVFVQGMVWDVTAIHTAYPDFCNKNVKHAVFHKDNNPFLSPVFKRVGSQKEMKEVLEETGPCLILATSGMMVGGSSVEYFKALAQDPKHSLIFTCFQGEGSLGRRLQNGETEIGFQNGSRNEVIKVNMGVYSTRSFTDHSTYSQLISFIRRLRPKPKKIILMHGESSKCLQFSSFLHKTFRIETVAPKNLESVRLR